MRANDLAEETPNFVVWCFGGKRKIVDFPPPVIRIVCATYTRGSSSGTERAFIFFENTKINSANITIAHPISNPI